VACGEIALIGLGPGDAATLSRGAEKALREGSAQHQAGTASLLLRTARHPVVDTLREWGLVFETFDGLYETATDFQALYADIAERVLATARQGGRNVFYAVPGHPLVAEETVRIVREKATAEGIPTRLVTSGSFVEASLASAGISLGVGARIAVRDALTLHERDGVDLDGQMVGGRPDVTQGLLLFHVHDRLSASQAKLALMRDYPDDWEIAIVRAAGVTGQESVLRVPLYRLDRETVDHLTSVYVPPLPASLRRPGFPELVGLMARLRAPDGCPWDREQDHRSLRRFFIEETYEVVEAIDTDDPELLCEELGDVLLQVVFHAQLAAETGLFTIDDVAAQIVQKLVRRHPHVFGDTNAADSAEVLRNWERIKKQEKAGQEMRRRDSLLDGIPAGLPALMQAMEVSKRVVKVGFEWDDFTDVLSKLDEEVAELKAELSADPQDPARIVAEMGDLFFTLVQVARWQKVDPEEALRQMLARFSTRFRHVERRAAEQQRTLPEMTIAEMDLLWDEAKAQGL
jgi:tetrapyrrole methylase family protein/MazG family protein